MLVVEGVMGMFDSAADAVVHRRRCAHPGRPGAPGRRCRSHGRLSRRGRPRLRDPRPGGGPGRRGAQPGGVRRPRGHAARGDRTDRGPSSRGAPPGRPPRLARPSPRPVPVAEDPAASCSSVTALAAAVAERRPRCRGRAGGGGPTAAGRSGHSALPEPTVRIAVAAGRRSRSRTPTRSMRSGPAAPRSWRSTPWPTAPPRSRRRPRRRRRLPRGPRRPPGGNEPLLAAVRHAVAAGLPTWAECGGLLWLTRSVDGRPMAGIVPATADMTDRLTLGYREATVTVTSPLGPARDRLRAHEFHYASVDPPGDALDLRSRFGQGRGGLRRAHAPGVVPPSPPRGRSLGGRRVPGGVPGSTQTAGSSQLRQRNSR